VTFITSWRVLIEGWAGLGVSKRGGRVSLGLVVSLLVLRFLCN
jgi:hypothetical protein